MTSWMEVSLGDSQGTADFSTSPARCHLAACGRAKRAGSPSIMHRYGPEPPFRLPGRPFRRIDPLVHP